MHYYMVTDQYEDVFGRKDIPALFHVGIKESPSVIPRSFHKHPDFVELVFMHAGTNYYHIDNEAYRMTAGDLLMINSGLLHAEFPETNNYFKCYYCGITDLCLDGLPENHMLPNHLIPFIHTGEQVEEFNKIFDLLITQVTTFNKSYVRTCHYLLAALLSMLDDTIHEHSLYKPLYKKEEHTLARKIKDYLDNHFTETITLDDIAKKYYVSPYHANKLIKKLTGFPPNQYIINRRMGEAQNLLLYSNDSVTDVARKVGYDNPNYFNVLFHKQTGYSPGRFRETTLGTSKRPAVHGKRTKVISK